MADFLKEWVNSLEIKEMKPKCPITCGQSVQLSPFSCCNVLMFGSASWLLKIIIITQSFPKMQTLCGQIVSMIIPGSLHITDVVSNWECLLSDLLSFILFDFQVIT